MMRINGFEKMFFKIFYFNFKLKNKDSFKGKNIFKSLKTLNIFSIFSFLFSIKKIY